MRSPWKIKGDDIVLWADRVTATTTLEVLVRRLLLATSRTTVTDLPAHRTGQLDWGWNGFVEAQRRSAFCPGGSSLWEISVARHPRQWLEEKYRNAAKYVQKNPALRGATYVAVSARRVHNKEGWQADKRRANDFADVRVIDADDLAIWLSEAPAVAAWFSQELGRKLDDIQTLDDVATAWSKRTRPYDLPLELLLAGGERERAAESVRQWLMGPPRHLSIHAETKDEARIFAIAALMQIEPERERVLARSIVVRDESAFHWAVSFSAQIPIVIIPEFDSFERLTVPRDRFIIAPMISAGRNQAGLVVLDRIPYQRWIPILKRAGLPYFDRLALESGGSLLSLQRLYGYSEPPRWATRWNPSALAAMLFVESWNPRHEADREVIRSLGVEPIDVERLCEDLLQVPEAKTVLDTERGGSGTWTWVSHAAVWQDVIRLVPEAVLSRFAAAAIGMLRKDDPRYELDPQQRFAAAMYGKTLPESTALRGGMARSLVRLSLSDKELSPQHGSNRGSDIAAHVVRSVLGPHWRRWASTSDVLPLLAEAAPVVFLECMEASVAISDEGVLHLLDLATLVGDNPHNHVLWALETLGWDPALLQRVAILLARWVEYDKARGEQERNIGKRLTGTLYQLLLSPFASTMAPIKQRLEVVRHTLREVPNVGFSLLMRYLNGLAGGGIWFSPRLPQIRTMPTLTMDELGERGRAEYQESLTNAVELSIEHAGIQGERWVELIKVLPHIPVAMQSSIVERLKIQKSQIHDPDASIWGAIRHWLYLLDRSREREFNLVEAFESLYELFTPDDPIAKYVWLFKTNVDLPLRHADLQARWDDLQRRREEALGAIWQRSDRWDILAGLIAASASPYVLGVALGRQAFAFELEARLLHGKGDSAFAPIVPFFIAQFAFRMGKRDDVWLEQQLRMLVDNERLNEAARALTHEPPDSDFYTLIDRIGEPLRSAYWRALEVVSPGIRAELWKPTLENLLSVQNIAVAVDVAGGGKEHLPTENIAQALEMLLENVGELNKFRGKQVPEYTIGELLDVLEADSSFDRDRIAALEIKYLLVFGEMERPLRQMSRYMAQHPEQMLEFVRAMYRPEGESKVEISDDEREANRRRAEIAYRILGGWHGYPGEGAPPTEGEQTLHEWALAVLRGTSQDQRGAVGAFHVSEVLARAPDGEDGFWPCVAARRLLETGAFPSLAEHLVTAKWNLRGMTSRAIGEGGRQERKLAASYRAAAAALQIEYRHTAAMLLQLARTYEHDAESEDAEARTTLRREGLEAPEDMTPKSSRAGGAAVEAGIVRIDRIEITNLRVIEELRLALKPPTEDKGQWIVLLGENGMGKTTTLRTIAMALMGTAVANAALGFASSPYPRGNAENGETKVVRNGREYRAIIGVNEAITTPNGGTPRPFVCGYGVTRGTALSKDVPAQLDTPVSPVITLFNPSASVYPAMTWLKEAKLRELESGDSKHQEIFEGLVQGILCRKGSPDEEAWEGLLPDVVGIDVADGEVWADAPQLGGRIPLAGLSDGYLSTIGWVVDLVARWVNWAETHGIKLDRRFPERMEGLILVDEIDQHLHPRWQRSIIGTLKKIFPRLSFIVTTHNPLTLLGSEDGEIHVLRWNDELGRVEARQFDLPKGIRPDQVLTGEWFGLPYAVDEDTMALVEEHQALLLAGTSAEHPRRCEIEVELRKRFGTYADTALDRMALEVAAELMRERRPGTPEERKKLRDQLKQRLKEKLAQEEARRNAEG